MAIDSIRNTKVEEMAAPYSTAPVAPVAARSIHTCPMHPEFRQDHPGNCPKRGMTLELATAGADEEESTELRARTSRFWIGAAMSLSSVSVIANPLRLRKMRLAQA